MYMSPEVLHACSSGGGTSPRYYENPHPHESTLFSPRAMSVTAKSDCWSLGCILHELLFFSHIRLATPISSPSATSTLNPLSSSSADVSPDRESQKDQKHAPPQTVVREEAALLQSFSELQVLSSSSVLTGGSSRKGGSTGVLSPFDTPILPTRKRSPGSERTCALEVLRECSKEASPTAAATGTFTLAQEFRKQEDVGVVVGGGGVQLPLPSPTSVGRLSGGDKTAANTKSTTSSTPFPGRFRFHHDGYGGVVSDCGDGTTTTTSSSRRRWRCSIGALGADLSLFLM
mmetsp:Transcript_22144/g.63121  ORF Transcript_22144/g.63121 Transcript_22144/m.63121 type:complete len:288 (-) Transcript_22144:461-1324(-)